MYELVIYTILPRQIVETFLDLVPDIKNVVAHTLCYEELVFDNEQGLVYKDIALLAHNRTLPIDKDTKEEKEGEAPGDILVVDVVDSEQHIDAQFITYLESTAYDGKFKYDNMETIHQALSQYRMVEEDQEDDSWVVEHSCKLLYDHTVNVQIP